MSLLQPFLALGCIERFLLTLGKRPDAPVREVPVGWWGVEQLLYRAARESLKSHYLALGLHYAEGEVWDKVVVHLRRAGARALRQPLAGRGCSPRRAARGQPAGKVSPDWICRPGQPPVACPGHFWRLSRSWATSKGATGFTLEGAAWPRTT
jgi:hypothetical protein